MLLEGFQFLRSLPTIAPSFFFFDIEKGIEVCVP
jgi:hypothetical protein